MKIDNLVKNIATPPIKANSSVSQAASLRQSPSSEPTAVTDTVRLTETADKIRRLEKDLSNLDINDEAKIQSVRQSIEDGSFKVDEEAVAEGLIQQSIADFNYFLRS